jgi:large subunit ribosomal protein L25
LELIELNVNSRTESGKGAARSLRRAGMIPAVLYGPNTEPLPLSVNLHELDLLLKESMSSQQMVKLIVTGGEQRTAMIKEMQRDPLTRTVLHADFYEVDMKRAILVKVPVRTSGKPPGVELGGMLQVIRRELEVLCLPGDVPEVIDIDVSELNIGDAVHVEEIPIADGVEVPHDVNFTVVTVLAATKVEEEVAEDEGEELEEGAEGAEDAPETEGGE